MPGRKYRPNPKSTPKEIVGHHGHRPHGPSILWPALYEHLRRKGYSKAKAARISNAAWKKKRMGIRTNAPTSVRGLVKAGEIVAKNTKKKQVFGWAYIAYEHDGTLNVDKSGEFVDDIDELEKTAYTFVLKSRQGGVEHDVSKVGHGTMIESVVFTPEKLAVMGLPEGSLPIGWWVGYQVNDDETWEGVEDGRYTSFSIHGSATKKAVSDART